VRIQRATLHLRGAGGECRQRCWRGLAVGIGEAGNQDRPSNSYRRSIRTQKAARRKWGFPPRTNIGVLARLNAGRVDHGRPLRLAALACFDCRRAGGVILTLLLVYHGARGPRAGAQDRAMSNAPDDQRRLEVFLYPRTAVLLPDDDRAALWAFVILQHLTMVGALLIRGTA